MENVTNPSRDDYRGRCPRCGQRVPAATGDYPGALSRVDNTTYICSECGTAEAMWEWTGGAYPLPAWGSFGHPVKEDVNG